MGDRPRERGRAPVRVSALLLCSNPSVPPRPPGTTQACTHREGHPARCPSFRTKHTSYAGNVLRKIPAGVREFISLRTFSVVFNQ